MNTFKKTLALVLTLAMVLSVVVVPASAAETYPDVLAGQWFAESVYRWTETAADIDEKGEVVPVLTGYPDGSFKPGNPITRAETAKTLASVFGLMEQAENNFSDVAEDKWYYGFVLAAAKAELVKGYPNGTFRPDKNISRQDAFVILKRAMLWDKKGNPETLKKFDDVSVLDKNGDEVNLTLEYAQADVAAMVEAGYILGDQNNEINAQDPITRAELMKVLDRMIGVFVDAKGEIYEATDTADVIKSNLVVVNANCIEDVIVTATEEGVEVAVGNKKVELIPENGEKVEVVIVGRDSREVVDVVYVEAADEDEQAHFVEKEGPDEPSEEPECKHENLKQVSVCENCAVEHTERWECEDCDYYEEEVKPAHTHKFYETAEDLPPVHSDCTCCGMSRDEAMKFELSVKSDHARVDMEVSNDYAATFMLTPGNADAGYVSIYAAMQDVDSLGVAEKREHSIGIETGLEGNPKLSEWLSEAFDFAGAELDVTVVDVDGKKYETDYIFSAAYQAFDDPYTYIDAKPADVADTRAAWQVITSHVETDTHEDGDDSYITIGNASYLRVVEEQLGFEKQVDKDLVLNNFNDLSALESEIRNTVRVYEAKGKTGVEAYLTAGTELSVGSSYATLTDDCRITIDGIEDDMVAGILGKLRDAEDGYAAASQIVTLINNLIGAIDDTGMASVTIAFAEPDAKLGTKFYFSVTAPNADQEGETKVDMSVYEDYSFEINVPMNTIKASEVKLYVEMKDVASLGVEGTKSHTLELNDIVDATPDLGVWLSEVQAFEDVTVTVNVHSADGTKSSCTYEVVGDKDYACPTITGTPVDVEATRAAWQSIADHVYNTTQQADNSYILIKNGSELAFNGETLMLETENDLELDNFSDLSSLKQNIKDNVCVVADDTSGKINMKVAAGSALAVGQSIAMLENDCQISVSCSDGLELPTGVLSGIRDAADAEDSNYALCEKLVTMLGELIAAADGADEITVDITFQPAE